MHELSLAEAISNTIKGLCAQSAWTRVRRVVLKVGQMRQVDPELLSFAFGVASKGTIAESAELAVMELPIVFKCNACGERTGGDGMVFVCLNCGSTNVDLVSGMELTIEAMEVEAGGVS
ncbi:MAG: hydrogenase maturation nickel metallochaperone HypA [Synergistaceae bacterium]|jgi:hydrogenase nickel incorporation protein HypA/HybF|nr:hydrogenase maturation nickel metallochaperone HypA [Synergistaceae bacterium]